MYSVLLEEKDGKKYYRKSRKKYWLEDEGAILLDSIPEVDAYEKLQFYYYDEESGWLFDQEAYDAYLAGVEANQEQQEEAAESQVTLDDVVVAMAELGANRSTDREAITDLELAVAELGAMIAAMQGGES